MAKGKAKTKTTRIKVKAKTAQTKRAKKSAASAKRTTQHGRPKTGVPVKPAIVALQPPATAKDLVYKVMNELAPDENIQDSTTLASLGYDEAPKKDIIRGKINSEHWHNVNLPFNALAGCTKISDITDVVTKAIPS